MLYVLIKWILFSVTHNGEKIANEKKRITTTNPRRVYFCHEKGWSNDKLRTHSRVLSDINVLFFKVQGNFFGVPFIIVH